MNSSSDCYFCETDELTKLCPSSAVIERFQSMALVGFEQLTSTVDDYQQCVELCLSAAKEFEFTCRSGQYFPTVIAVLLTT